MNVVKQNVCKNWNQEKTCANIFSLLLTSFHSKILQNTTFQANCEPEGILSATTK